MLSWGLNKVSLLECCLTLSKSLENVSYYFLFWSQSFLVLSHHPLAVASQCLVSSQFMLTFNCVYLCAMRHRWRNECLQAELQREMWPTGGTRGSEHEKRVKVLEYLTKWKMEMAGDTWQDCWPVLWSETLRLQRGCTHLLAAWFPQSSPRAGVEKAESNMNPGLGLCLVDELTRQGDKVTWEYKPESG